MTYIFNNADGYEYMTHQVDVGEKQENGFYNKATWKDVVLNGTDVDDLLDNEMKCESAILSHEIAEDLYKGDSIEVNPRIVSYDIKETTNGKECSSECKKIYIRKRNANAFHHKKFPTKPYNQLKKEKLRETNEKLTDEINDYKEFNDINVDVKEYETIVEETEIQDQLILSKDPVIISGDPHWMFYSLLSGEEFYIDMDATVNEVYQKWMKINPKF
jgi:hypothetical protein